MEKIKYSSLNNKQQESFNYQKLSGVMADYGYITYRMFDDYNGADLHAVGVKGDILKIQLKGRFEILSKYKDKNLYVAFPYASKWYLYPHDEFYEWVTSRNPGAKKNGGSSTGKPSKKLLESLAKYEI